jgi:hypothetical protein
MVMRRRAVATVLATVIAAFVIMALSSRSSPARNLFVYTSWLALIPLVVGLVLPRLRPGIREVGRNMIILAMIWMTAVVLGQGPLIFLIDRLLGGWWIGVLLLVAGVVLSRARFEQRRLGRNLALIGCAWLGAIALLFVFALVTLILSPPGY